MQILAQLKVACIDLEIEAAKELMGFIADLGGHSHTSVDGASLVIFGGRLDAHLKSGGKPSPELARAINARTPLLSWDGLMRLYCTTELQSDVIAKATAVMNDLYRHYGVATNPASSHRPMRRDIDDQLNAMAGNLSADGARRF